MHRNPLSQKCYCEELHSLLTESVWNKTDAGSGQKLMLTQFFLCNGRVRSLDVSSRTVASRAGGSGRSQQGLNGWHLLQGDAQMHHKNANFPAISTWAIATNKACTLVTPEFHVMKRVAVLILINLCFYREHSLNTNKKQTLRTIHQENLNEKN